MINQVVLHQNDPENLKLLRASSVAYNKAKGGEIKITYFLLFLAIAYPICYIFIKNDNFKLILFGCSFLLTVIIQIFSGVFKGNTSKGAKFKEEFDTIVFGLPWKSTIKKIDRADVLHYSHQYKGPEITDWYSTKISPAIDKNISIAILQHSNTIWDIGLRKIFRSWLIIFLVFYSSILFIFLVLKRVDGLNIFLLLFSLLSFYTHFISLISGHTEAINKRLSISNQLDESIRNKKEMETTELRDIQDEIYSSRQGAAKVPDFFFRLYVRQFNFESEEYIEEINNLYR